MPAFKVRNPQSMKGIYDFTLFPSIFPDTYLKFFFFIFPTVTTRIQVRSFLSMFCSVIMPLEHVLRDWVKSSPEGIVGAATFELGRNGGHGDQTA